MHAVSLWEVTWCRRVVSNRGMSFIKVLARVEQCVRGREARLPKTNNLPSAVPCNAGVL